MWDTFFLSLYNVTERICSVWSVCAQQHHPPDATPNLLFVEGQPVRRKKLKRKGAETACSRQKLKCQLLSGSCTKMQLFWILNHARFSWSYYSIKNMMWTLTSVWDLYQPFCFCFVVFTMNKCFLLKYEQNKTNSWSLEINNKSVEYDPSEFYKQHLFLFLFFFLSCLIICLKYSPSLFGSLRTR